MESKWGKLEELLRLCWRIFRKEFSFMLESDKSIDGNLTTLTNASCTTLGNPNRMKEMHGTHSLVKCNSVMSRTRHVVLGFQHPDMGWVKRQGILGTAD